MKFLVDAQLPVRLARFLQASGYDTLHTKDLPQQNATLDTQINDISIEQGRVVITKDSDFVDSFMTIQKPSKLLLVSTGNIRNSELEAVFKNNLSTLVDLLQNNDYIEMNRDQIIVHQ
jgi:predicted nuclease of predicted toxin-antitoxin system